MDSLGEWSAFSNSNNISFLDSEAWRTMSNDVFMSLFISIVFLDVVEIISSDDDGVSHFVRDNHSSKNFSSNANITSEWAFLVNIISLNGFFRGFEAKSDVSVISNTFSGFGE